MIPAVEAAIDALLPEPDRAAWLDACRRTPPAVARLVERLAAHDLAGVRVHAARIGPSATIAIDVQRWVDGAFVADYTTTVRISRLAPLFTVEHGFAVQNRHPRASEPTLAGGDGFGFIAAQQAVHADISAVLEADGLTELCAWDLDEPIGALIGSRWHSATRLPTVRLALFDDLFDLLDPTADEETVR